jgi:glycosyltransferase involved in cell wall biosynthesis
MKIGMIAPPWIQIPPPKYGGIELVIYNLVEGLTELGHEVILFAPKESEVSCRLVPYLDTPECIGLDSTRREKVFVGELSAKYAYAMCRSEGVDIVHDHTLSFSPISIPTVHTLHGPSNEGTVKQCVELSERGMNWFVSISDRQQELYHLLNSKINFVGTVYNSVNVKTVEWSAEKEDFFFFVGRANWEKGLDLAIRVACKAGISLVMAVKMSEDFEKEFFKREVQPWIEKHPKNLLLEVKEEMNKPMLMDMFKRAKCTLFTSQWEEPFGLVMIESMAGGTPVIALRRGAAPEVIVDGKTGFIVDTEEEMIKATKKVHKIRPEDCRQHVEENFSNEKMAQDYAKVYQKIISGT